MKTCLTRITALLVTLALLVGAIPFALAAERMDFRVLEAEGDTDKNAIFVVTKPKFYTADVSSFHGGYAVYKDILTGCHGIVDYRGNIVYSPDPNRPEPDTVIGDNLFLTSETPYGKGYLYDFSGKRLYDILLSPYAVEPLSDSVTGASLGFRLGETPTWWEDQKSTLVSWDGVEFLNAVGEVQNGLVCCNTKQGWSLWEAFGDKHLPDDYEYLSFTDADLLLSRQNGVYRMIRTDGTPLDDQTYDDVQKLRSQFPAMIVGKGGKYGLLNGTGSEIAPLCFDQIEQTYFPQEDPAYFAFRGTVDGKTEDYIASSSGYQTKAEWDRAHNRLLRQDWYLLTDSETYAQLADNQGQTLISESFSVVMQTGSSLVLWFRTADVTRFYDWDLNLLAEVAGFPSGRTKQGFAFSNTAEDGSRSTDFYDQNGRLIRSVPGDCVISNEANTIALERADGKCAFADGRGNLLTDYDYCYLLPISSGLDSVQYPYYCVKKQSGPFSEIIDGRTGKNALPSGYTVNDWSTLLPEGRYFPVFSNDKTGFARITRRGESPYKDVSLNDWYGTAVKFCYNAGLMNGVEIGRFKPGAGMTRAMLVQVLYNISGEKAAAHGFTDVPADAWFADAVNWAAENHIVEGVSKTKFAPNSQITREQMVTILYRYAKTFGCSFAPSADLSRYSDSSSISGYATEAMAWAVGNGIIKGTSSTKISPQGTATRAAVATILMRFVRLMANCE